MDTKKSLEQNQEYQEFLTASSSSPPRHISESILSRVSRDLNPSSWNVFAKLAVIHVGMSLVTLSVCPQFGFRILGEGMGLMRLFMVFGEYGCIVACGFFFLGMSLLAATLILRPEEIKVIRKNKFSELAVLTFLSLGFFLMIDAEVVFGIAVAWFFGSLAGGFALLEAGWALRRRVLA